MKKEMIVLTAVMMFLCGYVFAQEAKTASPQDAMMKQEAAEPANSEMNEASENAELVNGEVSEKDDEGVKEDKKAEAGEKEDAAKEGKK